MSYVARRENRAQATSLCYETHIRDKIRQQLQVLRDLGFLEFFGGGRYRRQ